MKHQSPIEIPPEPKETGVKLEQEKSEAVPPSVEIQPYKTGVQEYTLSKDLENVIEQGISDRTAMLFLRTITVKNEMELSRMRAEIALLRRDIDQWRDKYHESQRLYSIIMERSKGYKNIKILQNIFVTIGALFAGGSIRSFFDAQFSTPNVVFLVCGSLLMAIGWLYPFSGSEEK